jgi:hypothetical protein
METRKILSQRIVVLGENNSYINEWDNYIFERNYAKFLLVPRLPSPAQQFLPTAPSNFSRYTSNCYSFNYRARSHRYGEIEREIQKIRKGEHST